MRVTTIDGGFRGRHLRALRGGLAALPTSVQNAEAEAFLGRFAKFDRLSPTLDDAMTRGLISPSDAAALQTQFVAIRAARDTHIAQLSTLENEAALMEWRSTGEAIAAHAGELADRAGLVLGDTSGARPWQIAIALIGGGLLFGGFAYWISRQ
jgi:hypothetical protein